MNNQTLIEWKPGDIVARMDMALKVHKVDLDEFERNGGLYLVKVGPWDDKADKYKYFPNLLAEVNGDDLVAFASGVTPRTVTKLLDVDIGDKPVAIPLDL